MVNDHKIANNQTKYKKARKEPAEHTEVKYL